MVVLACGSNGNGQLGVGHQDDLDEFTPVPELDKITKFAGGGNHTVVIADGRAYGAGTNEQGQLGLSVASTPTFVEIKHPDGLKWSNCSAGWAFTILVDEQNNVWATGTGQKGELGCSSTRLDRLTKIFSGLKIIDLKSSITHTVLVTTEGVYGWGASRKGQLGDSLTAAKVVNVPTKITLPTEIDIPCTLDVDAGALDLVALACGREFTIIGPHILGNAPIQACGGGACEINMVSGWSTVGVLDKTVTCYGKTKDWHIPTMPLDKITAGSEHMLGTDNKLVYSWGWGEHGNCPPPYKQRNADIFAGCATSFISF